MVENLKAVVFRLNTELYGLNITDVGEIINMRKLFKVPGLADSIEGVINLRDKVTTVVNLSSKLGFEKVDANEDTKIILLAEGNIGFIADEVTEIINIAKENLEDKADLHFLVDSSLITSIAKVDGDIITILNTKELILHNAKVTE